MVDCIPYLFVKATWCALTVEGSRQCAAMQGTGRRGGMTSMLTSRTLSATGALPWHMFGPAAKSVHIHSQSDMCLLFNGRMNTGLKGENPCIACEAAPRTLVHGSRVELCWLRSLLIGALCVALSTLSTQEPDVCCSSMLQDHDLIVTVVPQGKTSTGCSTTRTLIS